MTPVVLSFIAFALYIIYISLEVAIFDSIPTSISNSFYLYESKKKNLGYVFTAFMFIESFLVACPFIVASEGNWYECLAFFCTCGIAFCGAAPLSRGVTMESKVHVVGASSAAVLGMIWCILSAGFLVTINTLAVYLFVVAIAVYVTDTRKECKTFWTELIFFTTILTVLIHKLIHMA